VNTLLLNAQLEYSVQNAKKVQDSNLERYKQTVSEQFFGVLRSKKGLETRDRHRNASSPAKLPNRRNPQKRASLQCVPRRVAPPVPCAQSVTNIDKSVLGSRELSARDFDNSQNLDNSEIFEKTDSESLEMSENDGSGSRHVSYHRAPPKPPRRVSSQKRHQSMKPIVKKRERGILNTSSHTSSFLNSDEKSANHLDNTSKFQTDGVKYIRNSANPKHNTSSSLDNSTNIHFEDDNMLSTFRDSNLKHGSRFDDSKFEDSTSSLNSSSFLNDSGPVAGKKQLSSSTKSAAMAMCDTLAEFSKLDTIAIACENLILEFDDLLDT
jgi:hypothetical protein